MKGGRSEGFAPDANGPSGRTVFEALVFVILLFTLLLVAVDRYYSTIKPVREQALVIELSNLRSAVIYFTMLNGRLPESMTELVTKEAVIKKRSIEGAQFRVIVVGRFVSAMTMDETGTPTDPFGNAFKYDSATGRVYSSTKGYESW